jgi:hypothetical protein
MSMSFQELAHMILRQEFGLSAMEIEEPDEDFSAAVALNGDASEYFRWDLTAESIKLVIMSLDSNKPVVQASIPGFIKVEGTQLRLTGMTIDEVDKRMLFERHLMILEKAVNALLAASSHLVSDEKAITARVWLSSLRTQALPDPGFREFAPHYTKENNGDWTYYLIARRTEREPVTSQYVAARTVALARENPHRSLTSLVRQVTVGA